jgi:hypothetical protein
VRRHAHKAIAARSERRSQERAERDRNRCLRRLAVALIAEMAATDETVTGMTLITPDGECEAIPILRGGRA